MPHLLYVPPGETERVIDYVTSLGIQTGPDFSLEHFDVFGVDDARALTLRASTRPLEAPHRTFVLVMSDMTHEAQNALLKTLEEPPSQALFIFALPSPHTLLPTVRSRMHMVSLTRDSQRSSSAIDPGVFLSSTPEKRITLLKAVLDTDERDTGAVISFLSSLEVTLGTQPPSPGKHRALDALYRARKYTTDKGSLLKPLLEQVALLIPRI